MPSWYVYIVQCADHSLYTGITTDLERRVLEHNQGRVAARYTRSRRPVQLVYAESAKDRSTACRREHRIKQLELGQKLRLVASFDRTTNRNIT